MRWRQVLPKYHRASLTGSHNDFLQEMDQLPTILQFLPPAKEREKDNVLRMMCVEILLLLSTSEFPFLITTGYHETSHPALSASTPFLVRKLRHSQLSPGAIHSENAALTSSFASCTESRSINRYAQSDFPI